MTKLTLIGTAHVSKKSVEEVERTIEELKPDAVAVELCPRRFSTLVKGEIPDISVSDVVKRGDAFLALFQFMLAYYQKKIGKELGVKPGEEMITAVRKAREIGADVLLIDRDFGITFKRLWQSMSFVEKLKMVWNVVKSFFSEDESDIEEILSDVDYLLMEFKKIVPNAGKVLVDERDAYMAHNLIKAMEKYDNIVAVVGAGHKKGIEYYLKNPDKIPPIQRLLEVKNSRFSVLTILSWLIPAVIIGMFILIFVNLGTELALKAFIYWFFINGILSAIGAGIARGHPLSILSAFLCAWMTSLNPLIGAGWISGLIEVKMRKPNVEDVVELTNASSFRELLGNRAFRVLLVAALTNVGSFIGTIVGAYVIMQMTGIDVKELIWSSLF
jgi:pheromone shutdown-related protein TraB